MPGLDLLVRFARPAGLLFDAALEGLDLVDFRDAEIFAIDERLDAADELFAQAHIAGDRTHFDEGLAFPGAAHGIVICQGAGQRARQGAAMAFGPEPKVDAIRLAAVRVSG